MARMSPLRKMGVQFAVGRNAFTGCDRLSRPKLKEWVMRRREFVTLFGAGAAAWPFAALAQPTSMPVVGFLHSATPEAYLSALAAFRKSLSEIGYSEGQNVTTEFRWAEGRLERLPELARDLVRRQVSVIFAGRSRTCSRSQGSHINNSDCFCEWS